MKATKQQLPTSQANELLQILKARFEQNQHLHKGVKWTEVADRLEKNPSAIWSLNEMEMTGGEPAVTLFDKKTGEYSFMDCSPETPKDRRSICYDRNGLESRKEHQPAHTAIDMADEMGITLLDETQYRHLQSLDDFDLKTSSWLLTPAAIRKAGGAIFGDKRYDHVFIYHNGPQSYYGSRGFRGVLKV